MKYIFEVHIREGYTAEDYADAWVRASELIERAPGARGTQLHRKIGDPDTLIAIAHWDSKAKTEMPWNHNTIPTWLRLSAARRLFVTFAPLENLKIRSGWLILAVRLGGAASGSAVPAGQYCHS